MDIIEELEARIRQANVEYRKGTPTMSDAQYDKLIEQLELINPESEIFFEIGHVVIDEARKVQLPTKMASLDKEKTLNDLIKKWIIKNEIQDDDEIVLSPKLDGLAFTVEESKKNGYTRGNGIIGQRSTDHYALVQNNEVFENNPDIITYGEVIMPRQVFIDKYSEDFANPRNYVGGLLNSGDASEELMDCMYIRYGISDESDFLKKSDILEYLNKNQKNKIEYEIVKVRDLNEEHLISLFKKWSSIFDIDGVILEINSIHKREYLGRERNGNPAWARAFKHASFEMTAESEIIDLQYTISKKGFLKPVIHINPVVLDGATVRKITGNNARFIKKMQIGIGGKILVKRSGMVIPLVVAVLEPIEFTEPTISGVEIGWSASGAELMTLSVTDEQLFKQAVSFFEILGTEQFAEGTIRNLWDSGFNSIVKISNITLDELSKLNGFGDKKPKIIFNSIKKALSNVQLSKIQHASGLFNQLGSKKLLLLEGFKEKPTLEEITSIPGFAEVSANAYLNGYDEFNEFIQKIPVIISEKVVVEKVGNDLDGNVYVFSGVRDKDLEQIIVSRGGKIGDSVSKNTSHLIMKVTGSGSGKETKAINLGVTILTLEDLKTLLV